jgi:hypothetical protein
MCSMECRCEMCSALIALLTCILAANVGFYKFRLQGFNLHIIFYLWIRWSNIFRDSKQALISKEPLFYVPPCIVFDR